jgi:hypothetical protein
VLAGTSCWLKTVADVKKKTTVSHTTACIMKSASPSEGRHVSIPAQVPGDLITDLQLSGLVGDPLYELNFLNASIWDANTWTYSTTFNLAASGSSLLVFDGVKMGDIGLMFFNVFNV